jgi:glutathione S-transferase
VRILEYTPGSPFARVVRILLDELDLGYERRELQTSPRIGDEWTSPTLQVPTFWDGDIVLWESGLIAEYLLATYHDRRTSKPELASAIWRPSFAWRDKLVLASVHTLVTTITTISQMTWTGVGVGSNAHLDRSAARLPALMAWLEGQLPDSRSGFIPNAVSVQDIFLASGIGFAQARPIGVAFAWTRYPRIAALRERLDQRSSFKANPVWWWDPDVVGYGPAGVPLYGNAGSRDKPEL